MINKARVILTAILLCLATASAWAVSTLEVESGGVKLQIPVPSGFSVITPEMNAIFDGQTKFWPGDTVHYLTFILASEAQVALRGEIPPLNRRLVLTSIKAADGRDVRSKDFSDLKNHHRQQAEQMMKQVRERMPKELDKFSERAGGNASLKMPELNILPAHLETERTMAFSARNKYQLTDKNGEVTTSDVTMTTTFLLVKGRLFTLNAYGEVDALEWTREASKDWADAILAANPPDETSIAIESGAAKSQQPIDWLRLLVTSLVGAALWGVIDLIRKKSAVKNRKNEG